MFVIGFAQMRGMIDDSINVMAQWHLLKPQRR